MFNQIKKIVSEYWELVLVFILALGILLVLKSGWGYFDLPSASSLVDMMTGLFDKYGLIVVFLAALIESILLVGGYFPGTLIIFLSLSLSGGDFQKTIMTVLAASAGMLVGYSVDYFLGKHGVHKILRKLRLENEVEKLKKEIERQGVWAGFFLYILPGFGSLISTTFGIIKYDYKKFLAFMVLTVFIWNSVWGLTGYFFGKQVLDVLESGYFGFIILAIFMIYLVSSGKYAEMKKSLE